MYIKKKLVFASALLLALSLFVTSIPVEASSPSATVVGRAVKRAYGSDYTPNVKLTKDEVEDLTGVSSDSYSSVYAEASTISSNVDSILVFKCRSDEDRDFVLDLMKNYQKKLRDNEVRNKLAHLKLQACRLYTTDRYVCFFILGEINSSLADTGSDSELLQAFREQNDIAVKAVKMLFPINAK